MVESHILIFNGPLVTRSPPRLPQVLLIQTTRHRLVVFYLFFHRNQSRALTKRSIPRIISSHSNNKYIPTCNVLVSFRGFLFIRMLVSRGKRSVSRGSRFITLSRECRHLKVDWKLFVDLGGALGETFHNLFLLFLRSYKSRKRDTNWQIAPTSGMQQQ